MTREELAYAAGLIDGEGCIGAYNTRTTGEKRAAFYQLTLRVGMKHPGPIIFLYKLFGFGRHISKTKYGPVFVWQARNRQAEAVLRLLLPYLIEKKAQAKLALQFGEFRRAQRASVKSGVRYTPDMIVERDRFVTELKSLKRTDSQPVWQ